VVDDDSAVRGLLVRLLTMEGFEVVEAEDGEQAVAQMRVQAPDIVLLDVMLPIRDGLDVLGDLRETFDVPVIFLTARGEEADRVIGLKMGADDYITKPFSPAELSARIDSVLRRANRGAAPPVSPTRRMDFGELLIDPDTREVFVHGAVVDTTAREFDLLAFFAASPRQVFTREQLLRQVWESSGDWQSAATVTEHVRRLRRKIEADPDQPRWIATVRGVGYRFEP